MENNKLIEKGYLVEYRLLEEYADSCVFRDVVDKSYTIEEFENRGLIKSKVLKVYKIGSLYQVYDSEVLDQEEREYLSRFIKPFRNKVLYISKESYGDSTYYISIILKDDCIILPSFDEKSNMYKGMRLDIDYTLEELGL